MPFSLSFTTNHNPQYILINTSGPNYIYSGPKLEEVAIFWQMVMEQKPAVVVMLTKVEENGKVSSLCTPKLSCIVCMPQLTSMHSVGVYVHFVRNNMTIVFMLVECVCAHARQCKLHHVPFNTKILPTNVTAAQV